MARFRAFTVPGHVPDTESCLRWEPRTLSRRPDMSTFAPCATPRAVPNAQLRAAEKGQQNMSTKNGEPKHLTWPRRHGPVVKAVASCLRIF